MGGSSDRLQERTKKPQTEGVPLPPPHPHLAQAAASSSSQWLNRDRGQYRKAQLAHSLIARVITLLLPGLPLL